MTTIAQASADCAAAASKLVQGSGEEIRRQFNGTPLVAYPGDSTEVVALRWHYERILHQLRNGTVSIDHLLLETLP